jgi:hypothetical protein
MLVLVSALFAFVVHGANLREQVQSQLRWPFAAGTPELANWAIASNANNIKIMEALGKDDNSGAEFPAYFSAIAKWVAAPGTKADGVGLANCFFVKPVNTINPGTIIAIPSSQALIAKVTAAAYTPAAGDFDDATKDVLTSCFTAEFGLCSLVNFINGPFDANPAWAFEKSYGVQPAATVIVEKGSNGANFVFNTARKLGSGAFGQVYKGRNLADGKDVAIKIIDFTTMDAGAYKTSGGFVEMQKMFAAEVAALTTLKKHFGSAFTKMVPRGKGFIAMTLETGITLEALFKKTPALDKAKAKVEAAKALAVLSKASIAHMDAHCGNFMVQDEGTLAMVVIDFGKAITTKDKAAYQGDVDKINGFIDQGCPAKA